MARPAQQFRENRYSLKPMTDSPVERRTKELPRGDGKWPGASEVWIKLQRVAHHLASSKHTLLCDDHIETMAVMGTGHEDTMKSWMHHCIDRGFKVFE